MDTERGRRFLARGNLGQFIYISRPDDIVVVRLGSDFGIDSWPQVLRDVVDRVRARLTWVADVYESAIASAMAVRLRHLRPWRRPPPVMTGLIQCFGRN